ncbi:MAG: L-fuculose phosphate aldolase [Pseudomonadota bacterium]|jgi:L-fuculose-phosphate aldolase
MRAELLAIAQELATLGLNKGTSGNVSVRHEDGFLITPSGMDIAEMQTSSMVMMSMDGTPQSTGKPSSEWRFHRDIYQAKPHVGAVIHTHSMFATTLACLQKDIPPFHYMIAMAGGDNIPCAPYALFGTQALSDGAIAALEDRKACLLANHGMIATGRDLKQALAITQEVETLCEQYWRALQIGQPYILSQQEMAEVFEQFKGYGSWNQS